MINKNNIIIKSFLVFSVVINIIRINNSEYNFTKVLYCPVQTEIVFNIPVNPDLEFFKFKFKSPQFFSEKNNTENINTFSNNKYLLVQYNNYIVTCLKSFETSAFSDIAAIATLQKSCIWHFNDNDPLIFS
jgi:hypothetical protein